LTGLKKERRALRGNVPGSAWDELWCPSADQPALMEGPTMRWLLTKFWGRDEGQDIAEYAVMLAVILVIVLGTVSLIGSNANTIFSTIASSLQ
jgi:Flp pilus assembly pilin Flp